MNPHLLNELKHVGLKQTHERRVRRFQSYSLGSLASAGEFQETQAELKS